MEVRVKDLDVGITDDVGSRYLFFSLNIDADDSRLVARHLEAELFEVEDDVRHIIPDARNRGELVENAIDSDGGNRSTFERRQQHAAQAVAERRAVTALERLADELAVAVVFTDFRNFNFRFLDVYHLE